MNKKKSSLVAVAGTVAIASVAYGVAALAQPRGPVTTDAFSTIVAPRDAPGKIWGTDWRAARLDVFEGGCLVLKPIGEDDATQKIAAWPKGTKFTKRDGSYVVELPNGRWLEPEDAFRYALDYPMDAGTTELPDACAPYADLEIHLLSGEPVRFNTHQGDN